MPETTQSSGRNEEALDPVQDQTGSARPTGWSLFASGLIGSIAAFLAACSGSDLAGVSKNASRKKGEGVDGNDGADTDAPGGDSDSGHDSGGNGGGSSDGGADSGSSGGLDSGEDNDACFANTTNTLKLDDVPEMPAELKPVVKFYGRDASALVALKFAGMPDIKHVILCREDGKLIALHGIGGADKGATAFRPIVMDHVSLTGASNVKVVIVVGDKSYQLTVPKAYFTTYNNLPVVDLSGLTVPAGMEANQSVAQFGEVAGTFNKDPNVVYPNDFEQSGTVRNLQTVKTGTKWSRGAGVKGTVTDIMGDAIDVSDSGLIEYQTFCTYVESGGKAYRTIIRLG